MQNNTQESWEGELIQDILGALEYRGFHDCGKYLDDTFLKMVVPKIRSLLSKQTEEISEAVEGLKVPEVHSTDCEYQRKGCDCGYMERCSFNRGISDTLLAIKQVINK